MNKKLKIILTIVIALIILSALFIFFRPICISCYDVIIDRPQNYTFSLSEESFKIDLSQIAEENFSERLSKTVRKFKMNITEEEPKGIVSCNIVDNHFIECKPLTQGNVTLQIYGRRQRSIFEGGPFAEAYFGVSEINIQIIS